MVGVCARHPSQLYEAVLEGVLLFIVIAVMVWRRGWFLWPGRVAGLFFAGYGAARFFVEFFRQPDPQFITEGNPLGLALHVSGYGLTMGQILSLPMIVAGVWFITRARRAASAISSVGVRSTSSRASLRHSPSAVAASGSASAVASGSAWS